MSGGAVDDSDRVISFMITNDDGETMPKPSIRRSSSIHPRTISVRAYPQPAGERVHLRYNQCEDEVVACEITNVLGQIVLEHRGTTGVGMKTVSFNVTGLPNGIYRYRLSNGAGAFATGSFAVVR